MRLLKIVGVLTVGLIVSSCNATKTVDTRRPPEPLPSSPTEPVQTGELQPINPEVQVASNNPQPEITAPTAPTVPELEEKPIVNASAPEPSGKKITREGMAGSWNVPSDNAECRIILAFTKWDGGYKAAARRCNAPSISTVTAWDVRNQQVVLFDGSGTTVATLYNSGASRYDGSLNSGGKITFTR